MCLSVCALSGCAERVDGGVCEVFTCFSRPTATCDEATPGDSQRTPEEDSTDPHRSLAEALVTLLSHEAESFANVAVIC